MATTVKKGNTGKNLTVDDAAKALKESAKGGAPGDGGKPEDAKPEEESKPEEANTESKAATEEEGAGLVDLSQEETEFETAMPVPDDAACEKFAKELANSPAHLEAFRKTIAIADSMITERNKGPKKTAEELATANYDRLVGTYGKDFVTAQRGTNRGYYSRKAWIAMKNKHGWVEVTKTMPEVAAPDEATEGNKA